MLAGYIEFVLGCCGRCPTIETTELLHAHTSCEYLRIGVKCVVPYVCSTKIVGVETQCCAKVEALDRIYIQEEVLVQAHTGGIAWLKLGEPIWIVCTYLVVIV